MLTENYLFLALIMITLFILYIVLGIIAGTLAGFFGIGGGVILVPSLLFCFKLAGIPEPILMHMTLGTSLSCIFVTAINSVWSHHQNSNTDWPTFKKLLLGIVLGTICGAQAANKLSSHTLEIIFTIFLTFIFLKMCFQKTPNSQDKMTKTKEISKPIFWIIGLVIGFKSAVLGIGGGTISIPFLTWTGKPIKKAIGISASIGLPISLFGFLSYIYNGWNDSLLPSYSFGYVYLPAFIGIISTSALFASFGAKFSNKVSSQNLHRAFCIFLLIVVVKTYLSL